MASKQHNDSTQKAGGGGNFANDPQRASEAGRKGGQQSHQGSANADAEQPGSRESTKGSGNLADNRERASETGRKGGQHSNKS